MRRPDHEPLTVALRMLARDAHRLAVCGVGSPSETATLSRRIDRVRRLSRQPASAPLRRWLDNLERLIGCRCVTSIPCDCGMSS